jgi:hypothetical protein
MTRKLLACLIATGLMTASTATWTPGCHAAEAIARVDRSRLPLGESFHVHVAVRGSRTRPMVHAPAVPFCTIQRLDDAEARQLLGGFASPVPGKQAEQQPPPAPARSSPSAAHPLVGMLEALETAQRNALGIWSEQSSQPGSLLSAEREAFRLLRETREQALLALQSGRGSSKPGEYPFVFRVTPQRAGVLTMPAFVIQADGRTLQTPSWEITVDPAGSPSPGHAATAPQSAAGPNAPATSTADRGPKLNDAASHGSTDNVAPWWRPWAFAVLALPLACAALHLIRASPGRRRGTSKPAASVYPLVASWTAANSGAPAASGAAVQRSFTGSLHPEELGQRLAALLCHRFGLHPGEITPGEVSAALRARGCDAELVGQIHEVLCWCQQARFAPDGAAALPGHWTVEASRVLARLERYPYPVTAFG